MAYDFPDNPTPGQAFQNWTWNGEAWVLTSPTMSAGAVSFTPAGDITSTDVQNAIVEVDAEMHAADALKVAKAGDTMSGPLTVNSNVNVNGDLYSIRSSGSTGIIWLGNTSARYLFYDGTSYNLPGASLQIGAPINGSSAATVTWTDNGYLPRAGGTITGGLTVNGELVAATNYLRFVTSGGPGYIQFNGGSTYTLGGGGTIWNSNNFTPSSYVSNGRLVYVGDFNFAAGGMQEPYSGAVVTGFDYGGSLMRLRAMQLFTSGWFTIGYA